MLSDNAGGAFAATAHLIAAGHRRIAFLGDQQRIFTATERLRGYREALAEHGIPYDEALVRMELHGSDAGVRRRRRAARARPIRRPRIFSAQNLITIGTVQRLRALDLHRTIALVGFDDLTLADAVEPGLTVVAQDAHELGRLTAELLFARLDGDGGPTAPRRGADPPDRARQRGAAAMIVVGGEALYDLVLQGPRTTSAATRAARRSTPPARSAGSSSRSPTSAGCRTTRSARGCSGCSPTTASRSTPSCAPTTRRRWRSPRSTTRASPATASTSAARPRPA